MRPKKVKTETKEISIKDQILQKEAELNNLNYQANKSRLLLEADQGKVKEKELELKELENKLELERNDKFIEFLSLELIDILTPKHFDSRCSDNTTRSNQYGLDDHDPHKSIRCTRCVLLDAFKNKWLDLDINWKFTVEIPEYD